MSKRYFSVAEANLVVPLLEQIFGRVLRLRSQIHAAVEQLQELGEEFSPEDPPPAPSEHVLFEVVAARTRAHALVETLREDLRKLQELGVEVKDLDIGLCDFLARREGRDVYLCWKL